MNLTWKTELGDHWVTSETTDLGIVSTYGYSRIQLYMIITNITDLGGSIPNEVNSAYVQYNFAREWQLGEDKTQYAYPPSVAWH